MPYLRHTSPADNPAACSFSTLMICSSVNLLLRMSVSRRNGFYPKTGTFRGSRSRRAFVWDIHGDEVPYDFTVPQGPRKPETLWDEYQSSLAEARSTLDRSATPLRDRLVPSSVSSMTSFM